ncbi:MAG: Arm DNA-binding domain-containing protein [Steroidobacteraceae bacterium]
MPVQKLRQNNVRALPYVGRAKQQCIYWDARLTGLGLRVYPSGQRTFVCAYRFRGRKRLASLGRADVLTLEEARRKTIRYLAKLADDADPQAEIEQRRSQKTVADLCAAFIENHAKHKRVAWQSDESCLKRRILPKLHWRPAASIVTADIEAIHSKVGREHPYAANNLLDLVRKMFNWGKVAGFMPKDHANPALGIVRFPERTRRRFITTVEMPHFIRGLEAEDNEYARHGLWLLLLLGLRSKELLNSKWSDIDWEMGTLFIGSAP